MAARGRWRQHNHWRVGDVGRSDSIGEVQNAWAVGHEANAGSAGDAAESIGHQGRALLVPHPDELDVVAVVERVENVQERGAYNPENVGDPFLPKQLYDRLAGLEALAQIRHLRPAGLSSNSHGV